MTTLPFSQHNSSAFHEVYQFYKRCSSIYPRCDDFVKNPSGDPESFVKEICAQLDQLEQDALTEPADGSKRAVQTLKRIIVADEKYGLVELDTHIAALFTPETLAKFKDQYKALYKNVRNNPGYFPEFYQQFSLLLAQALESEDESFPNFIEAKFYPAFEGENELYSLLLKCYVNLTDDVNLPAPVAEALLSIAGYYSGDSEVFEIYDTEDYHDLDNRLFPNVSPDRKLKMIMGEDPVVELKVKEILDNTVLIGNLRILGIGISYDDLDKVITLKEVELAIKKYEEEKQRILRSDAFELVGIRPQAGS